jgi:DNA-binding LytR/AlgR family response regulator
MSPPPSLSVQLPNPEYITLPTARADNIVVHAPSEVLYLEGAKDYTEFVLTTGARHLVFGSLGMWVKRLAGCGFLRVHRSYALNVTMLEAWRHKKPNIIAKMQGNEEITVGLSYKAIFLQHFT